MEADAGEARERPTGRVISEMVAGLEDTNERLVAENTSLRQELEQAKAEIASLQKELRDTEAERDDWMKECETHRRQQQLEPGDTLQQVRAEYEQHYQTLATNLSEMDQSAWFSIIHSRE